jgi:hypothetical protein
VEEALAGAHPKHFSRLGRLSILCRIIIDSRMRHAAVPVIEEDMGPVVGGRSPR